MDDRLSSRSDAAAAELRTTVVWPGTETQTTSPITEECEPQATEDKCAHDSPYFLDQFQKARHGCSYGTSNALPTSGRPRGPGGRGARLRFRLKTAIRMALIVRSMITASRGPLVGKEPSKSMLEHCLMPVGTSHRGLYMWPFTLTSRFLTSCGFVA